MNNRAWRTLTLRAHLVENPRCVLRLHVSPLLTSCRISFHSGEDVASLSAPLHLSERSPRRAVSDSEAWCSGFVVVKSFVFVLNTWSQIQWSIKCFIFRATRGDRHKLTQVSKDKQIIIRLTVCVRYIVQLAIKVFEYILNILYILKCNSLYTPGQRQRTSADKGRLICFTHIIFS